MWLLPVELLASSPSAECTVCLLLLQILSVCSPGEPSTWCALSSAAANTSVLRVLGMEGPEAAADLVSTQLFSSAIVNKLGGASSGTTAQQLAPVDGAIAKVSG